jgi:hypothetical protein
MDLFFGVERGSYTFLLVQVHSDTLENQIRFSSSFLRRDEGTGTQGDPKHYYST